MSGFTLSYRAKWEHPIFRDWLEAAIWSWLCDTAVWKDCRINFNGEMIALKRGQLVTSLRFVAKGFRVSVKAVRTLFERLENDSMISTQRTHKGTQITICNYEKYQLSTDAEGTQTDTQTKQSGHTPGTNKKELNKDNKRKTLASVYISDFETGFWPLYPRREDKQAALKAYRSARNAGASAEELVCGAKRYADEKSGADIKYIKLPATWLNAGSWANGTDAGIPATPSQPVKFDAEWKEDAMRIGNLDAVACKTFLSPTRLVVDGQMARIIASSQVSKDYVENRMGDAIRLAVQKQHPTVNAFNFIWQRNEPPTQEVV